MKINEKTKKILKLIGLILSIAALAYGIWEVVDYLVRITTEDEITIKSVLSGLFSRTAYVVTPIILILFFVRKKISRPGIWLLCAFISRYAFSYLIYLTGRIHVYSLAFFMTDLAMILSFLIIDRPSPKAAKLTGIIFSCIAFSSALINEITVVINEWKWANSSYYFTFDWSKVIGYLFPMIAAILLIILFVKKSVPVPGIWLLASFVLPILSPLVYWVLDCIFWGFDFIAFIAFIDCLEGRNILGIFDAFAYAATALFFLTADRNTLRLIPLTPEKELKILTDQHKNGKITDEEYQTKRAEIISKL